MAKFEDYVSLSGAEPTALGEITRCLNKIVYRYYNDGDMYDVNYGIETVSAPTDYVFEILKNINLKRDTSAWKLQRLISNIRIPENYTEQEYKQYVDEIENIIIDIYNASPSKNALYVGFGIYDVKHLDEIEKRWKQIGDYYQFQNDNADRYKQPWDDEYDEDYD